MKIQGLDNKYILFLIDGVRISGEFAGNLDFNMINLTDVERIEIVEGGMSVFTDPVHWRGCKYYNKKK